jgi:glutamine amidotransferase
MNELVIIVDYGMGNMQSIRKQLTRLGVESIVTSDPSEILRANKIILPGVGHFGKAMDNLTNLGLVEVLSETVLHDKTPVLGICLGMQLMAKFSEEGGVDGLGWIDGVVTKFRIKDTLRYKVPCMGWNTISKKKDSKLLSGIDKDSEYYFMHGFHLIAQNIDDILAETIYNYCYTSAVERENIYGVQFHPEKSHDSGFKLIQNFVEM